MDDEEEEAIVLLKRCTSVERNPHSYARCRKVQVFNAALAACERAGEADAAKRVMQDMEMAGVDADRRSYSAMIRSCRREPARHAQAAMDAFERLRWRYGESVGAEQYRLIVEVLWGARRVGDALQLLDECERAEKLARACVIAAEGARLGATTLAAARVSSAGWVRASRGGRL